MKDKGERMVKVWHFWNSQSGLVGGIISGLIIVLIILILGAAWK